MPSLPATESFSRTCLRCGRTLGYPPADWQDHFLSSYASAHPWEDWAETWAHYLHIVDTLETARNFSLRVVTPERAAGASIAMPGGITAYRPQSIDTMVASWLPLTYAINSINRSMGQPDMYPFVLSPMAVEKLGFVHRIVSGAVPILDPIPADRATSGGGPP